MRNTTNEPMVGDPAPPNQLPQTRVINDPDIPDDAPVDDVFDPATETADVTD